MSYVFNTCPAEQPLMMIDVVAGYSPLYLVRYSKRLVSSAVCVVGSSSWQSG